MNENRYMETVIELKKSIVCIENNNKIAKKVLIKEVKALRCTLDNVVSERDLLKAQVNSIASMLQLQLHGNDNSNGNGNGNGQGRVQLKDKDSSNSNSSGNGNGNGNGSGIVDVRTLMAILASNWPLVDFGLASVDQGQGQGHANNSNNSNNRNSAIAIAIATTVAEIRSMLC